MRPSGEGLTSVLDQLNDARLCEGATDGSASCVSSLVLLEARRIGQANFHLRFHPCEGLSLGID